MALPIDRLQCYLKTATLPKMNPGPGIDMPLEGHKTHRNLLSTCPRQHRKLEMMFMLDENMFDAEIIHFTERNIPKYAAGAMDRDPYTRECITVPNEPDFPISPLPLEGPCDMMGLHLWLLFLPLKTVQRIIHYLYPTTREYRAAMRGFNDVDAKLFQYIKWGVHNPDQIDPDVDDPLPSLVIVIQPPWILSSRDLESFVRCREFPRFDVKGQNARYQSKERLWAKIWDLSVEKNCRWFVVSTYWGWVFGVFSKGWTRAFVSHVKNYSDVGPTVMECLIYWICSSMDIPGGFKIPEVSELVQNVAEPLLIPTPDDISRLSRIQPSESWSGGSSDLEQESYDDLSQSDETTIGPKFSARRGQPQLLSMPRSQYRDISNIKHWLVDQFGPMAHEEPTPQYWRDMSPGLSGASDNSSTVSAVKGYGNDPVFEGGWLTGDPGQAHANKYLH